MNVGRTLAGIAIALTVVGGSSCGGSDTTVSDPPGTSSPISEGSPRPAEVLDAAVVFFDGDSMTGGAGRSPIGVIDDESGLATFADRHVDGDPELGTAAADALDAGKVLVGGPVSTGCSPASSGQLLLFDDGDVRLTPIGGEQDPNLSCYRAVVSVVLMAIDPADLPAGVTVQGLQP